MKRKSDKELLEIIVEREEYRNVAVIAALNELKSRRKLNDDQQKILKSLKQKIGQANRRKQKEKEVRQKQKSTKEENILKFKHLTLPFLIISTVTIFGYSLVRWLFSIRFQIIDLNEELWGIWLPMIVPATIVLLLLRRRIRLLSPPKGRYSHNDHSLYQLLIGVSMVVPMVASQFYLDAISYDLIPIKNVAEVRSHPGQKYFELKEYSVETAHTTGYVTSHKSGRYSQHLNIDVYFVTPFREGQKVWYGVKYHKQISNSSRRSNRQTQYQNFIENSETDIQSHAFERARYFEKIHSSKDLTGYKGAVKRRLLDDDNLDEHIILEGHYDEFQNRSSLSFVKILLIILVAQFLIALLINAIKVDKGEVIRLKKGELKNSRGDFEEMMEFLNPFGKHSVAAILILLNVAVFTIATLFGIDLMSPNAQQLLEIGGNRRIDVLDGDWWRLFTSMFLHAGIAHIVYNMFGLALSFILLDKILRRSTLIILYISTGLIASICSITYNLNVVSVGASGAIFGMLGVSLAFLALSIFRKSERSSIGLLLGGFILPTLLFGFISDSDNAAHFGGLVSGFVLGGMYALGNRKYLTEKVKKTTFY